MLPKTMRCLTFDINAGLKMSPWKVRVLHKLMGNGETMNHGWFIKHWCARTAE